MTSQNPQPDIYDPKTLAAMDQAFAAVWYMPRPDDPFPAIMPMIVSLELLSAKSC